MPLTSRGHSLSTPLQLLCPPLSFPLSSGLASSLCQSKSKSFSFCLWAGLPFSKPQVISLLQQGEELWKAEEECPWRLLSWWVGLRDLGIPPGNSLVNNQWCSVWTMVMVGKISPGFSVLRMCWRKGRWGPQTWVSFFPPRNHFTNESVRISLLILSYHFRGGQHSHVFIQQTLCIQGLASSSFWLKLRGNNFRKLDGGPVVKCFGTVLRDVNYSMDS